ncbi:Taurine catabolism dioxygenase TauD/TfdA [Myxococcus stipitatus DSM 14675]|uniref:Taurine catabolism dioxygenase TauD/TfdA n=1 Tax=Myxococcus stipitatus (strain DSM 14675 / JCM 12634 / Mx s8) TaxID=1278073 RepID=L7UCP2_MYXSD|nr:TauD/TfdA family dioxygenase [Myxococcus stipitatus]AGC45640.1 Taurine catabolism dioxygenase TauD/TfdA [Myxococcus stipitatus DSM 14675]
MLPFLIEPPSRDTSLLEWIDSNREQWRASLLEHGALLFRGFHFGGASEFGALSSALYVEPLRYVYRSTPRTELGKGVYTATEYPRQETIPQHNENAYSDHPPMNLCFLCVTPAERGGETPLTDNRLTTERIPVEVRQRFEQKRIMYVRNYGPRVDLPWQTVFQTQERSEVEAYCRAHGIEFEWKDASRLRTRQVLPAVTRHPLTGEAFWFNQAHLFHVSGLEPKTRQALTMLFKKEEFPRNAYHGDGSELDGADLETIRAAYQETLVTFPWRTGDVLLVDNLRVTHGRRPYEGTGRKVLVSMGDCYGPRA